MEYPRLLIDTSILIDHFRNQRKDITPLYQVSLHYECVISSITEFEFLVGSNQKNYSFINELLSKLSVTHNLQFMTLNIKHFEKIENLNLYHIMVL
jgi:predicted nucleic acid-binding protein